MDTFAYIGDSDFFPARGRELEAAVFALSPKFVGGAGGTWVSTVYVVLLYELARLVELVTSVTLTPGRSGVIVLDADIHLILELGTADLININNCTELSSFKL